MIWTRTLHVLAAIWVSTGVFASALVFSGVKRTEEGPLRAYGLRLGQRLTTVYTVPGLLLAGALGFYQVTAAGYGFGPGWVKVSALLYLVLLVLVLFIQVPALRKAVEGGGALPPAVAMLTHVDALLIVVLALLMGLKPF